jgi:hypothetical protein
VLFRTTAVIWLVSALAHLSTLSKFKKEPGEWAIGL